MKLKVTVEFEEGLKASSTRSVTTEVVLLSITEDPNKLREVLTKQAQDGAASALKSLYNWMEDAGPNKMVAFRTKSGIRECLKVTDVNEAKEWLNE